MRAEKVLEDSMVTRILNSVENAAVQQAKDRPFYYKVFKSIHTGRGSTGSGNSNYPVDPDRGLELLDLHSHYLPGNQLSMCACVEVFHWHFSQESERVLKKESCLKGGVAIEALQNVKSSCNG